MDIIKIKVFLYRLYFNLKLWYINPLIFRNKQKYFCIGLHKTGTTSLVREMRINGISVGHQLKGVELIYDWAKRDFKKLNKLCRTAEFFQDTPFSLPFTYIILEQTFPDAKFILTVRDDAEEWYNSLIKFHSKLWGDGMNPPTGIELKNAPSPIKGIEGIRYDTINLAMGTTEDNPYKKDVLIKYYENHIFNVKEYFKHIPDKLCIINLKSEKDYKKFCNFIGIETGRNNFPWENKTDKIKPNKLY